MKRSFLATWKPHLQNGTYVLCIGSCTHPLTPNGVETMMKMKGWSEVNGIHGLLAGGYRHLNLLIFSHLTHHFHYFLQMLERLIISFARVGSILFQLDFPTFNLYKALKPAKEQRSAFYSSKKVGFLGEEALQIKELLLGEKPIGFWGTWWFHILFWIFVWGN